MTKDEDFKLLKIQTCVLKVNIHCDGCKQEVKKLLQRIEGVYRVQIDAEQQKATVSGSVDSATLIKKLVRSGKYAELWSQKTNHQNEKQKNNSVKDHKNKGQKQELVKGLEVFKNQQKFPAFSSEEDDEYYDYDDEEEEDEEDEEMRFIREKAKQLQMLRQQAAGENNVKKGIGAISGVSNNGNNKMNNNAGNANGGKKGGGPNHNMGTKKSPSGVDQKTVAALKLNNEGLNLGEAKRASDIGAMMNLAGFNGNGANVGSATILGGGNSSGLGGFPVQSNNMMIPGGINSFATGQYPSSMLMNMNGFNNHPSPSPLMMNMNMPNRHAMQQQPQMMYHRSPFIPPDTGYYYNYNYPASANYSYALPSYPVEDHSAAHMFSDDNTTSSCSIM